MKKKIALFFVKDPEFLVDPYNLKLIQLFKNEYKEIKFYKVRISEKTKTLTKGVEDESWSFYEDGKNINYETKYQYVNLWLTKLSNRESNIIFYSDTPFIKVTELPASFHCMGFCPQIGCVPKNNYIFKSLEKNSYLCPQCVEKVIYYTKSNNEYNNREREKKKKRY